MLWKSKVYAYIVQDNELVVFTQPHAPEAGVQVPGGSVEADETLEAAVLREALEETGLQGLEVIRYLGEQVRDMRDYGKDELHHRHFYHLACAQVIQQHWHWVEQSPSDGSREPILFTLYRTPLEPVPDLIADLDVFLRQL